MRSYKVIKKEFKRKGVIWIIQKSTSFKKTQVSEEVDGQNDISNERRDTDKDKETAGKSRERKKLIRRL